MPSGSSLVTAEFLLRRLQDPLEQLPGYRGFAPGPQGLEPLEKKKGDEERDDRKSAMDPRSHWRRRLRFAAYGPDGHNSALIRPLEELLH